MGSVFLSLLENFQVRSLQGIVVRFIQIPKKSGPDSTWLSALVENLHLCDIWQKQRQALPDLKGNACFTFRLEKR